MLGDAVGITLNKNTIHGDKNALSPGAVRIGTCALTSRGMVEKDFVKVADFLDQGLELCKTIQDEVRQQPSSPSSASPLRSDTSDVPPPAA